MKLTVDKISPGDLPARVRWINDRRVNQYMYFELPITLDATRAWYRGISESDDRHDLVFKNEFGIPVGMAGITAVNKRFGNGEFYLFVNPEMQGRGIGKAITAWMLQYAFATLDLFKVYLYVDGQHRQAIELYKKIGFIKEGHLRRHRLKDGVFHDKLVFGMLRSEWKLPVGSGSAIEINSHMKMGLTG